MKKLLAVISISVILIQTSFATKIKELEYNEMRENTFSSTKLYIPK
jgi:hypothetical protein